MNDLIKLAVENPSSAGTLLSLLAFVGCVLLALRILPGLLARRDARRVSEADSEDAASARLIAAEARAELLQADLLDKIEDRGRRLHEISNKVGVLELHAQRQDKEIEEMRRRLERLTEQHNAIALDFVEVKADVRHTKELCERLDERLEKIEGPITLIAAWVAQRQSRVGPLTP